MDNKWDRFKKKVHTLLGAKHIKSYGCKISADDNAEKPSKASFFLQTE